MDKVIEQLLTNNKQWAEQFFTENEALAKELSEGQSPKHLWFGCSDSRVPANIITGMAPGDLFVHRTIANQAQVADVGVSATLEYAVGVLKVEHIIICGHYSCGGVLAALNDYDEGKLGQWIEPIKAIKQDHLAELEALDDAKAHDRLCELNVTQQVEALSHCEVVKQAWANNQPLAIHGLIYDLKQGRLTDLGVSVNGPK